MGVSIRDLLSQNEPEKPKSIRDLLGEQGTQDQRQSAGILRVLANTPDGTPEQAGEALTLSRRMGVPPAAAIRNLDALREMSSAAEFDADTFVRENPVTTRWLTADPINAAVARDDFESLSKTERIFGRWRLPSLEDWAAGMSGEQRAGALQQVQRGTVQAAFGQAPEMIQLSRLYANTTAEQRRQPEVKAQIDALRAQMPKLPEAAGIVEASARFFAEGFVPSMGYIAGSAGVGAMSGAAGGALAGAVGGPAAGVTAGMGATVGATVGAFTAAREFSKAQMAMTLDEVKDANGRPLSDNTIDLASEVYGVFGGALELGGYNMVGRQIANSVARVGAAEMAERAAKTAATNLLTQTTGRRVAYEVAKTMAVGVGVETGEEVAAEFTAIGTEALARIAGNVQGGQFGPVENVTERLLTTAYQTALGSIWFGGLAGGAVGIGGMNRLAQARQDAEVLNELSQTAELANLRKRDPEKYAEVIAAQVPVELEKVGIESERLVMLLQEASIPLAQFAEVAGITEQEVQEAIASGGDVYLPMPQVMSRLVGTPIFEGMKPDLKLRPDGMSQREADAMAKEVEAESAKIQEEMQAIVTEGTEDASGQRVIDELIAQITAATAGQPKSKRFTDANIEQTARGIAAFYITQAQRTGVDAYELYASRGYSILGRQQGEGLYDAVQELRRLRTEGTPEQVKEAEAKVRQQGELLQQAAFHGTPTSGITQFDRLAPRGLAGKQNRMDSVGSWFSLNAEDTKPFLAGWDWNRNQMVPASEGTLYQVELDYSNPKTYPTFQALMDDFNVAVGRDWKNMDPDTRGAEGIFPDGGNIFNAYLKAQGYDAIVVEQEGGIDVRGETQSYIAVLSPETQVTITHRNGEPVTAQERTDFLAQEGMLGDTIDVDGVSRPTTNSTGQPIHPTAEGVRNFWRWFGDSKVVDEQGRPLVVYHGTDQAFTEFSPESPLSWFAYETPLAVQYSVARQSVRAEQEGRGASVYPVYIKASNPLTIEPDLNTKMTWDEAREVTGLGLTPSKYVDEEVDGIPQKERLWRILKSADTDDQLSFDGYDAIIAKEGGYATIGTIFGEQVKSALGNSGAFGPSADILTQGTGRPNAFIIPGVGQQTIALMNGANLSSLLHEFAHDWLVILGEQAAKPDAPAQVRADYAELLKQLGVASTAEIGVEQQENFARMWERYYATAEAPSRALARVFTSFKRWMQKVYKDVREMFVPVSPEVARLFDRMIATDAELELARGANGSGAMLTEKDGEALGATPDEMEGYAKAVLWRTAQEEARLIKAVVEDEGKEMTEQYQAEAESVRAEVRAELEAQPVYRAYKFLREPDANGNSVKLNVEQFEAEHGKRPRGLQGIWSTADKAPFAKKEGGDVVGTDAETMALAYGFRDGTAFIDALRAMEDLDVAVERRVREEMRVRFPDLTPFSQPLADEAQRVQHLADTDDVLVRELNLLAKSSGIRAPNVQAVKRAAKAIIAKLKVRDIRPIVYQNAEAKAARLAMEAFKAGDPEKAAFHKRQQLLNHILYREAVKQKERVAVIQRFAKRMMSTPTQERMGKAGKVYQDALNALLQSYDFRSIPLNALDALEYDKQPRLNKTATLNAYKEAALEDALVVASIPASVMEQEGVLNFQQLSVMDLDNVYSVMHQVYETASRKDKALRENEKRNLQEQADAFVESVTEKHTLTERPIDYYPFSLANAKQKLAAVDAWHLPPEFLFVWLDGDTTGTAYTLFFKPFVEAEAEEFRRGEIAFKEMQRIEEMIDLPSVLADTSVAYEGIRSKMTKRSIISLALNMGTESGVRASLEAQVDGKPQFGSYDAIMAMFAKTLTEADWKYITAKWDYANTFWPDIAELERQTNGIIPQKLEAAPFFVRTADGKDISVKGGYYPLSYASAKLGAGGAVKVIARTVGLEEGVVSPSGGARAQTMHGWTEERVKASGRPLNLDLNVWNSHIVNVIHDLTHRKAVRDVYRLYKRKDVRQTIEQSAGQEAYNALMPWLARIANPNQSFDNSFAENTLARARAGVTAVNMGLSVSVAMVQPLGYLQAADVIGPMWVAKGIAASFSPNFKSVAGAAIGAAAYGSTLGPAGTAVGGLFGAFVGGLDKASADVLERSVAMRQRREDFSRDARDYVKTRKNRLNGFEKFYFSFIGMMDNAVMVPVWIGAYRKAMAENGGNDGEAVQYADSVIRRSQGAGSPKDLSRVQGGPELRRMLTIHYSFMSRQYGLFRRTITNATEGRMTKARVLASVAMIGVLSPILSELVAGRPPEDDEDWLPWAMLQVMQGAAGSIVLLRDVARALGPKAFPYKISPVEDALKKSVGAIQTVGEQTVGQLFGDEDADLTESELKEIVETVGYWTRTPTRAVWRVVTSFTDWMQGFDVAPADFIRSAPR